MSLASLTFWLRYLFLEKVEKGEIPVNLMDFFSIGKGSSLRIFESQYYKSNLYKLHLPVKCKLFHILSSELHRLHRIFFQVVPPLKVHINAFRVFLVSLFREIQFKIYIMSALIRTYSSFQEVKLLPIEERLFHKDRYFQKQDEKQIEEIVSVARHTNIQKLLRFIHGHYRDEGLRMTLIHKLFECKSNEISYYVPELVYIAIRKNSKHMKKLLITHAKNNESLRRLILWNVKAFTVLMKEKSPQMKKMIEDFQESLIEPVKNKAKFTHSLRAIAMLTEASLILKKMPQEVQKQKLKKFIRRFNSEYLTNVNHTIIIPFRHEINQKYEPDYVVGLVENDCSCFPTRKRVPYRIIIETIDIRQLNHKKPDEKYSHLQKVEPDTERDLFSEVTEAVQKIFQKIHMNIPENTKNLFAVDTEESKKYSQLQTYLNDIVKKEMHIEISRDSKALRSIRSKTMNFASSHDIFGKSSDLLKYKIEPSQNLTKFESIYIPDIGDSTRRSDFLNSLTFQTERARVQHEADRQRRSEKFVQEKKKKNVKIYEQELKETDYPSEEFFGKPWEQKKIEYKKQSYYRKFQSLRLRNVVVKGGDDLRQQIICMQLIYKMKEILNDAKLDIFIKPYEILVLSQNSGILEFVSNSISIDQMKKKREEDSRSIEDFFYDVFRTDDKLEEARHRFTTSLVGSSIMTYVLKLKDRHNGNILIDMDGNIIHIDFGFILGMAPGNINFEKSPFKFTSEYLEFLGGKDSKHYKLFCDLFYKGMKALRERVSELCLILEIMMEDSDLDCFKYFDMSAFKNMFKPHYTAPQKFKEYCNNLVEESCQNKMTVYYDNFQNFSNGICP